MVKKAMPCDRASRVLTNEPMPQGNVTWHVAMPGKRKALDKQNNADRRLEESDGEHQASTCRQGRIRFGSSSASLAGHPRALSGLKKNTLYQDAVCAVKPCGWCASKAAGCQHECACKQAKPQSAGPEKAPRMQATAGKTAIASLEKHQPCSTGAAELFRMSLGWQAPHRLLGRSFATGCEHTRCPRHRSRKRHRCASSCSGLEFPGGSFTLWVKASRLQRQAQGGSCARAVAALAEFQPPAFQGAALPSLHAVKLLARLALRAYGKMPASSMRLWCLARKCQPGRQGATARHLRTVRSRNSLVAPRGYTENSTSPAVFGDPVARWDGRELGQAPTLALEAHQQRVAAGRRR